MSSSPTIKWTDLNIEFLLKNTETTNEKKKFEWLKKLILGVPVIFRNHNTHVRLTKSW